MSAIFTCTACAATFVDPEAQKAHYKLDWHRYNLRRKVAGLGPVDQGDFDRRLAAALGHDAPKANFHGRCSECRKSFRSEGLYKQHLQSKKHKDVLKAAAATTNSRKVVSRPLEQDTGSGSGSAASAAANGGGNTLMSWPYPPANTSGAATNGVENSRAGIDTGLSESVIRDAGDEEAEVPRTRQDGAEGGHEEEETPPPMGPCVCVFCDAVAQTFEDNCEHMLRQHGFFIPDVEYLVDPEGLIRYVEEKVKLGNICLYCNGKGKNFHTYRALQQHMTDRSHCKLLYAEEDDMHEYESFYDFSPSYEDAAEAGVDTRSAREEDSSRSSDEDLDEVEVSRTLGVTDIGELVLLDGRTVGNRKWSRYYKQRLRTPDERAVVIAQREATKLRLGAIYDEEMRKGSSTAGVVALHRGQRRAYGGLPGVSRPKDVKILRAHQRIEAKERLKTGLKQNKLNKTFDRVADM